VLTSVREVQSPLFGLTTDVTPDRVFYFLTSAFYASITILFFATLVVTIQPSTAGRLRLRARFAFFVIPTLFVIVSVLVGMFLGIVGPVGRDAPSFVYYLFMYNVYAYLQLWGFWPIEVVLAGAKSLDGSESTKMFVQATQPSYTHLEKEDTSL